MYNKGRRLRGRDITGNSVIYVQSILQKRNLKKDDVLYSKDGERIGRVIHVRKANYIVGKTYYHYDIETTETMAKAVKKGFIKIAELGDYYISESSMYYRKLDNE